MKYIEIKLKLMNLDHTYMLVNLFLNTTNTKI